MKVFLAGSKEISVKVLEELLAKGHDVKGILSRDHEDGMKFWLKDLGHRSLREIAEKNNIPVYENMNINSDEFFYILASLDIDIVFSVCWGEIIKERTLNLSKLGFFNIHTAYLPKNRGSFPMAWSIIDNLPHTGITIHKIATGVDDGPIVSQQMVEISSNETGESIYKKVTDAGVELFKKTLPLFENMSFTLTPQIEEDSTYHPRGYPYGGQINPYWSEEKKDRFVRSLYFPPFQAHTNAPEASLLNEKEPTVRIMLGFDCDRPRGSFIASKEGAEMAERKHKALLNVNEVLEELKVPRTYFICGQFLESMHNKFGTELINKAFNPNSQFVEIADHTYSHQVMKKIATRSDKNPLSHNEVAKEYLMNSELFKKIFGSDRFEKRGFRTPLGHNNGIWGEHKLIDTLKRIGAKYISSDLRDENDSLHPKLTNKNGEPRQPYRYENGMLEIPSIGWQDTVFSGTSKTKPFENFPKTYEEIMNYYNELFAEAKKMAIEYKRDIYLGLVLHPYDYSFYNNESKFFGDMKSIANRINASFHTYEEVYMHYSKFSI